MLDAILGILGFFEGIFNYLINVVDSLVLAFSVISEAFVLPMYLTGFVPGIIGAGMTITVALGILKFALGR